MSCNCIKELRRRAAMQKERAGCRYSEKWSDDGIRCALDGSVRKKGCPCVKYEGRLSHRVKVALEFIING